MYKFSLVMTLALILTVHCHASQKLYKWKDEKGNIHYSDKKPANQELTDEISLSSQLPFGVEQSKPLEKLTSSETLSQIWLYFPSPVVDIKQLGGRDIGKYFFGPDCVSPTSMKANRLVGTSKNRQSAVIPRSNELAKNVALYFKKFKYPISSSSQSSLPTDLRLKPGLALKGEVIEFKLHLCAPKKTTQYFGRYKRNRTDLPEAERLKVFSRQRSMVNVKWSLIDVSSDQVLWNSSTQGVSNKWQRPGYYFIGMLKAIQDSLSHVVVNPEFLELSKKHKVANRDRKIDEPGFFDWVSESLGIATYKKRAQFANAMAYVGGLRTMTLEIYMQRGSWPDNEAFQKLLDNDSALLNNGIEDISIASDGSLFANLDSSVFGDGSYFSLRPDARQFQVSWSCESNLPQSLIQDLSCETVLDEN